MEELLVASCELPLVFAQNDHALASVNRIDHEVKGQAIYAFVTLSDEARAL